MHNLDEVIRILLQFRDGLDKKQSFYDSTRALNPNFFSFVGRRLPEGTGTLQNLWHR